MRASGVLATGAAGGGGCDEEDAIVVATIEVELEAWAERGLEAVDGGGVPGAWREIAASRHAFVCCVRSSSKLGSNRDGSSL